jgi:hypothetical protein
MAGQFFKELHAMAERKDEEPKAAVAQLPDNATVAQLRAALTGVNEGPTGPNATTEPERPEEHFFLTADGRKVNAYGEEIDSKEARQRLAARGLA